MDTCKILASSFILLEMANFNSPFNPQGLENDIRMGNCSGYKSILKNIPYVYQKPLIN